MINKLKILFCAVIFGVVTNLAFAQKVNCDSLCISFMNTADYNRQYYSLLKLDDPISSEIPCMMKCEAYISIENSPFKDTINVYTGMFLGVNPVMMEIYDNDNSTIYEDTVRVFTVFQQKMPIRTYGMDYFRCKLTYYIESGITDHLSNVLSAPKSFSFFSNMRGSAAGKFYPYCEGMTYDAFYVKNLPDTLQMFSSYVKDKNSIRNDIASNGLNLTFIVKSEYIRAEYIMGRIGLNIYFLDTISKNNFERHLSDYADIINKLKINETMNVDVVTSSWRDEKRKSAFGVGCDTYIFCDSSFLHQSSFIHEMLHCLYPIVTEKSKGRFFIGESMIEWLTSYLYYGKYESQQIDSSHPLSLYEIEENHRNTFDLIYIQGPNFIEQFAQSLGKKGEERVSNLILGFLRDNSNKTVSYDDFITYLLKRVPKDKVMELDKQVKS